MLGVPAIVKQEAGKGKIKMVKARIDEQLSVPVIGKLEARKGKMQREREDVTEQIAVQALKGARVDKQSLESVRRHVGRSVSLLHLNLNRLCLVTMYTMTEDADEESPTRVNVVRKSIEMSARIGMCVSHLQDQLMNTRLTMRKKRTSCVQVP